MARQLANSTLYTRIQFPVCLDQRARDMYASSMTLCRLGVALHDTDVQRK